MAKNLYWICKDCVNLLAQLYLHLSAVAPEEQLKNMLLQTVLLEQR